MSAAGTVYLVGAGPGDPGLLTVRGRELLAAADVVIFDGLVGDGLLEIPRASAELIYAGKKHGARGPARTQKEICELIVKCAMQGRSVVRLKGGDPLVFGRVSEELEALMAADIPFEIVPGVSALTAVPAYAGIPLTRRRVASTVAFATGHAASGRELTDEDFAAFANADTVVLFMAVSTLASCMARLIAGGRAPETPALAIYWGTTASQKILSSTLGELAETAKAEGLKPPALIVVGDVGAANNRYPWFESRRLAGARVLIGRPKRRSDSFASQIAVLGGEPLLAPLTAIVPSTPATFSGAREQIKKPAAWITFSSATAVERYTDELVKANRDLRWLGQTRIAAVGASTAAALANVGVLADLVPKVRSSSGLAAELIEAMGEDRSGRVLVVRAEGGRDDAEVALRAAGIVADVAAFYRSDPANASEPKLARALERIAAGEVDIACFFAPSQVRAFVSVASTDALSSIPLVAAIGKTTEAALHRVGVPPHLVASDPDPRIFASEVAATYSSQKRTPKGTS